MGVSANQARLMTLTARQHDLELRAQSISAQKMITSLESQTMATAYSTGLNNYSIIKQAETVTKNGSAEGWFKVDKFGNVSPCEAGTAGAQTASAALNAAKILLSVGTSESSTTYLETKKANYETAIAGISAQEKMLDMELTQINTEHTAIKTEYDSIKSLIGDNVEKSFNVFG